MKIENIKFAGMDAQLEVDDPEENTDTSQTPQQENEDPVIPSGDNSEDNEESEGGSEDPKKPENDDQETEDPDDSEEGSDGNSDEEVELSDTDQYLTSILEDSGEEFTDEELAQISSSDNGFTEATRLISEKKKEKAKQEILNENPTVKRLYEHIKNGGDEKDFFKVKQEKNSLPEELDENDVISQRKILREQMKLRGFSDEQIEEDLNDFEENDLLYKKSDRALADLKNHYADQEAQLERRAEQAREQRQKQINKTKEEASTILSSNDEIAGLALRDKKDGLVDYMFSPDDNGQTPYSKDIKNLPLDKVLAIGALIRSGFDIDSFVKSKVSSQRAKNLKQRFAQTRKTSQSSNGRGGGAPDKKQTEQPEVSIDTLKFD